MLPFKFQVCGWYTSITCSRHTAKGESVETPKTETATLGGYVTLRDSPRLTEFHLCASIRVPRLQVCLRDLNFHNLGLRSTLFLNRV